MDDDDYDPRQQAALRPGRWPAARVLAELAADPAAAGGARLAAAQQLEAADGLAAMLAFAILAADPSAGPAVRASAARALDRLAGPRPVSA